MTFGERIYKIRTEKGLTQDELATAVGYKSRSTIAKIESGERDAPQTMIVALAKALGTTPSYLMGWDEIEETLDFIDTITDPEHTSSQVKERDAKIRAKISALKNSYIEENNSEITNDELQHIKKYRKLDPYGQEAVDSVLDVEYRRCNTTNKQPVFTFRRLNANKASAGTGFDLNNPDEWKEIEVIDTPEARQADFAVEIEGESMEPDYYDGDIVYISLASEVRVGQVGLFIQNGKGYIKEAGNGRIISRNPEYDDIYPSGGDIECKGRVIGVAKLPD